MRGVDKTVSKKFSILLNLKITILPIRAFAVIVAGSMCFDPIIIAARRLRHSLADFLTKNEYRM